MNIFQSDNLIGFTYKPYASTHEKGREYNVLYQINSIGLRDREYGPKKKGVFRILLLGDSFSASHGMPIEDSLARQLERSLQSIADQAGVTVKIEVINAACGGYSPYNYWKAYRRWASILNPDAVIVVLSPDDYDSSNAFMQYIIQDGMILGTFRQGQKQHIENKISITKLRKWLSWNSEFYILLRNFLYYNDIVGHISMWMNSKAKGQNPQLEPYMVPQTENITKAWAITFSYLQNLNKETNKDGIQLIIMSAPMKLEIDIEQLRQTLSASGLKAQQININQPLKQITDFCVQHNIPLLDPRVALRKRHKETPCYFVYDGHWIAAGLHAATDSIALQWRNLQLPPWNSNVNKNQP
jgi:hypothetical protein